MTQIIDLSAPQLERKLGRVISQMELVVAKNLALGVTAEQLCDILGNGITVNQIEELRLEPSFQELYGVIAQHLLELSSETAIGWDQLEAISIRNLMKEARVNRDPDFQLRLAAVANKAQRRHNKGEQILEPGAAGTRVQISLSQRFIRKLNGETEIVERTEVRQMQNPSMEQIQRVLHTPESVPEMKPAKVVTPEVSQLGFPRKPAPAPIQTADADAALSAVMAAMRQRR